MNTIAKWALVGVVVGSPLLLGADSCQTVHVPNGGWANSNAYVGIMDADRPSYDADHVLEGEPERRCADDPWGLSDHIALRHALDWVVYGLPPDTIGNPDGVSAVDLRSQQGWYGNKGYIPTKLILNKITFAGQPSFYGYWYTGHREDGDCSVTSTTRCEFIRINPQLQSPGVVDVISGWTINATGQNCVTIWRSVRERCYYPTPASRVWESCYMPTTSLDVPNFTGREP